MNRVGDRHAGTLDGKLEELGTRSVTVTVVIESATAATYAVQHTAWMLVNLLARLDGVVDTVMVDGGDAELRPRITPLSSGPTLREALLEAAANIGVVEVRPWDGTTTDYRLRIGPGEATADWRVHGEGYCGAFNRAAITAGRGSQSPFGPYIAACLAASEIFRATRFRPDLYEPVTALSFSAWDYTLGPGQLHTIGPDVANLMLEFGLAGVGAVGCAFLHALWACPQISGRGVLADADPDGVDDTNLNRCCIFGRQHVGQPKATTAAALLADSEIAWDAVDKRYAREHVASPPDLLVSAVDTNRSRSAIQQSFWLARLLGASTKDLRAEVLRCGPPNNGPCLSCFNPPEVDVPDDLHRAQLRALPAEGFEAFAAEVGYPSALIRRWAQEGGCSTVGDAALARLRATDDQPATFSVGFVSVMAGTLLAVETIKEHLTGVGPLDDHQQNVKFQFERPTAERNGRAAEVQRDPACSACDPTAAAARVWQQRWATHAHRRIRSG